MSFEEKKRKCIKIKDEHFQWYLFPHPSIKPE